MTPTCWFATAILGFMAYALGKAHGPGFDEEDEEEEPRAFGFQMPVVPEDEEEAE